MENKLSDVEIQLFEYINPSIGEEQYLTDIRYVYPECGLIKSSDKNIINKFNNSRSCDVFDATIKKEKYIPTDEEMFNFVDKVDLHLEEINIGNLFWYYTGEDKKLKPESAKSHLLTDEVMLMDLIIDKLNKHYIKEINNSNFFKIYEDRIDETNNLINNFTLKNNTTAFIQTRIINKKIKFIIFGDFHGSIHTFLAHLIRLKARGIINSVCEIQEGYNIYFCGDLIDRGGFSLDLLKLLLLFWNLNKDKVFFNRGNHENYNTFLKYGFQLEVINKIPQNEQFRNKVLNMFNYLPSASIYKVVEPNKNKHYYVWFCHGGYPYFINDKVSKIILTLIKNSVNSNKNFVIESFKLPQIRATLKEIIEWSDFDGTIKENKFNKNRSISYIFGSDTIKFYKDNNIKFVFRGHQDSFGTGFALLRSPKGNGNLAVFNNEIELTNIQNLINSPKAKKGQRLYLLKTYIRSLWLLMEG